MTSGTASAASIICENSYGGANAARLSVGTWSVALLTNVRTSASVMATFSPREAYRCRSSVIWMPEKPNWVSRCPWLPTLLMGTP